MRFPILAAALVLASPALSQLRESELFPISMGGSSARNIVEFETALASCPKLVRGPKGDAYWRSLFAQYRPESPPNKPAIFAWVRSEVAKKRAGVPPAQGWCDFALYYYGDQGRRQPQGVKMRDGTEASAKCFRDRSCLRQNEITIYLD